MNNNPSMIIFDKSKLTMSEEKRIKSPKIEGIEVHDNGYNVIVYDNEFEHPEFMCSMLQLLYKCIKR